MTPPSAWIGSTKIAAGFLRVDRGFDRIEIIVRHLAKPGRQRIVAGANFFLAGCGQRRQGPAVKRIVRREDLVFAAEFFRTITAHQLNRGFVGFRAAVAKKRAIGKRMAAQLARQLRLRLAMIEIGNMQELLRLLFDRFDDRRVTMTQAVNRDAGKEIEIFLAIRVPNPAFPCPWLMRSAPAHKFLRRTFQSERRRHDFSSLPHHLRPHTLFGKDF